MVLHVHKMMSLATLGTSSVSWPCACVFADVRVVLCIHVLVECFIDDCVVNYTTGPQAVHRGTTVMARLEMHLLSVRLIEFLMCRMMDWSFILTRLCSCYQCAIS